MLNEMPKCAFGWQLIHNSPPPHRYWWDVTKVRKVQLIPSWLNVMSCTCYFMPLGFTDA